MAATVDKDVKPNNKRGENHVKAALNSVVVHKISTTQIETEERRTVRLPQARLRPAEINRLLSSDSNIYIYIGMM